MKKRLAYLIISVMLLTAILSGCMNAPEIIDPENTEQQSIAPEDGPATASAVLEKLEKIMYYSAAELDEINKYVERSAGVKLTLHKSKTDDHSLFTRVFSDKLEGPYSERRLLLINGGHNNLFRSIDGKLYTTAFYGNGFSERPAIAEIEVTDEGLLKVK